MPNGNLEGNHEASTVKRSIRQSSPMLKSAEKLVDFVSVLPVGPELREMAECMRSTLDLPDRFNAAFTPHGWVYVEFCCGYEVAGRALEMKEKGLPPDEIDTFLADNLINIDPLHSESNRLLGGGVSEPSHPVRAQIVDRAFRAYREADFIPCVPLVLMLIDSFGVTKTGTKSIFSDLTDLDPLFELETSVGGHPSGLKTVLGAMVRAMKGYSEEPLTLPSRNGILHGTRLNYSDKIVATKALCVLAAVIEWARDSATPTKKEFAQRKWNERFLRDTFARVDSRSPDEALNLLRKAFNNRRPNEAVAVIDYHPGVTDLRSKLLEWKDLFEEVEVELSTQSDWKVFGAPTDSEQYARCDADLCVSDREGAPLSRIVVPILAKRQAALKEIDLGHVWQIDLCILGTIRGILGGRRNSG